MIKSKVVSLTINEAIGGVTKLDLETYLEDPVDLSSFYVGMDFDGLDTVIMTKEEYESMDSVRDVLRKSLNEKEGEICKLIVSNDVEQARLREKIKKLETENSKLKEENKALEEDNKALKNKDDKISLKITGELFYYKED